MIVIPAIFSYCVVGHYFSYCVVGHYTTGIGDAVVILGVAKWTVCPHGRRDER